MHLIIHSHQQKGEKEQPLKRKKKKKEKGPSVKEKNDNDCYQRERRWEISKNKKGTNSTNDKMKSNNNVSSSAGEKQIE